MLFCLRKLLLNAFKFLKISEFKIRMVFVIGNPMIKRKSIRIDNEKFDEELDGKSLTFAIIMAKPFRYSLRTYVVGSNNESK